MNIYSQQFSPLLEALAEALDIPNGHYELAVKRYESIGTWLERDGSIAAQFTPLIYPQGSFLLGTVTRPISEKDEYDLDLVSELNLLKNSITQADLKKLVGREIKSYANAHNMKAPVKEGRRCWTLHYADSVEFHIDILPAIPDAVGFKQLLSSREIEPSSWLDSAIAITDNTLYNYNQIDFRWPCSNPKGYAKWFRSRMQARFEAVRKFLEKQVDEVPKYKIKTPLQQGIQILKRHRDIWFEKNRFHYGEKAKPISIIITTLAALAYDNEADIQQALLKIVRGMPCHIDYDSDGMAVILNPVNPLENFADKWQEYPIRKSCFMDWLKQAQLDLSKALELSDIQSVGESLKFCLGERVIKEGFRKLDVMRKASNIILSTSVSSALKEETNKGDRAVSVHPRKPFGW